MSTFYMLAMKLDGIVAIHLFKLYCLCRDSDRFATDITLKRFIIIIFQQVKF